MSFKPLLQFDTDDPEFVRGFELGRTWALLSLTMRDDDIAAEQVWIEAGVPFTLHAANAEMVLRLGEALDLDVRSEELGDEWIEVWFTRREEVEA